MVDNIGYRLYLDRVTLCETAKSLQTPSGTKINNLYTINHSSNYHGIKDRNFFKS